MKKNWYLIFWSSKSDHRKADALRLMFVNVYCKIMHVQINTQSRLDITNARLLRTHGHESPNLRSCWPILSTVCRCRPLRTSGSEASKPFLAITNLLHGSHEVRYSESRLHLFMPLYFYLSQLMGNVRKCDGFFASVQIAIITSCRSCSCILQVRVTPASKSVPKSTRQSFSSPETLPKTKDHSLRISCRPAAPLLRTGWAPPAEED